jgi:zinc-binding in reverse transcriptase
MWLNDEGTLSKDYHILWHSKLPLKIQIFLWLIRKNRILTKDNLVKRGWQGNTNYVFCLKKETYDHLFVTCPLVNCIWQWIACHNNFDFHGDTLEDIWFLDASIPVKHAQLVEMIRGAVMWTIWLERNNVCFNTVAPNLLKPLALEYWV